ncbi:MAG: hypothetical protein CMJ78_09430 [Planctomycetaceae bacterium]|nr:hypothetical protein [Planctomycetaceae bacterium]
MKRWIAFVVLLLGYLATGVFVVGANEAAIVRRCGRIVRNGDGNPVLISSGLHFDWPYPLAQVDRFNVNEERTLTIGIAESEGLDATNFLQTVELSRNSQFITGDKNILNAQVTVHYRLASDSVEHFLFRNENPESRLRLLLESVVADTVMQSGVDFVHTLGRNELREQMIGSLRELASKQQLGVEVDDVTIGSVYPPVRVKSHFLDVTNARADKQTYINQAKTYGEERDADANAARQRLLDEARIYRSQSVQAAKSKADSFEKLVTQFRRAESSGEQTYTEARNLAMQRKYAEVMNRILRRAESKVVLDSGKPVDITILRDPKQ